MSEQKLPLWLLLLCIINIVISVAFITSGLVELVMPRAAEIGGTTASVVTFIVILPVPIVCFVGAIFPIFFAQNGNLKHARLLAIIPVAWALMAGALTLFILNV